MNQEEQLKKAQRSVERLVLQYKEYIYLSDLIKRLKTKKLESLGSLSAKEGKSISEIKSKESNYPELGELNMSILQTQRELDQTSDEMTFANPLVWIMYKDIAYKGASNEIADWKAFKEHCAPKDYICGKRFRFLESYLKERENLDFTSAFPDDTPIDQVYKSELITRLVEDLNLMQKWQHQEYLRTEGFVNKWQTVRVL